MQVCAAWLSLLLATPGLAAPPAATATSEALQARIFTIIRESDPEETLPPRTPRPLSELVAAAELAAAELVKAPPEDVYGLLSLLHDARSLAYRRSQGDASHLCAELGTFEELMRRDDLAVKTAERVARLDAADRSALASRHPGHVCEAQRGGEADSSTLMPVPSSGHLALRVPRPSPPPIAQVGPTRTRISPTTIAGGLLLAVAGGLAVAVAPVQVSRARLRDQADALRDEVTAAGVKTPEDEARSEQLRRAEGRTRLAMTGLATSAAMVAVVGAVLVAVGVRRQSRRLELVPQAGIQGAGLLVQGRF